MPEAGSRELFQTKLDIHDRKQFELKLEYQPTGTDDESEYLVEAIFFVPRALNVTADTWPREAFYADLHNYVRFKTPVLSFDELLTGDHSPLVQLEQRVSLGLLGPETEVVYDAKMLGCILRGALRRFARGMKDQCARLTAGHDERPGEKVTPDALVRQARASIDATQKTLQRFRATAAVLASKYALSEKTCASLRLVDEYLSLLVEQFFRRVVVQMNAVPRTAVFDELRRELMDVVVADERYRKDKGLSSVIAPDSDNEEYTHRIGFLKKFCMNILFLDVHRSSPRKAWEEVLFALAAGLAMAFALGVGLFAQTRYPQVSFNFFVIAVIGYMLKDRIKEGLRRLLASYAGKFLYERSTRILDPVTHDDVGVCKEKVDYGDGIDVPGAISALRAQDDLVTAAGGELPESVIRYRKKIVLESEMLPRVADGIVSGVTDIIRVNVERLLHDMDDPDYTLDYVDLEDFSVEKLRAAKAYRVDVAFRFSVDDGKHQETTVKLVRLVLDKNGIKRMSELTPTRDGVRARETVPSSPPQPAPRLAGARS
ncbi:MAG: hypothetical protein INH41_07180 [Myxococcaceae bacterium]|nr:hypothetical protein [Myxococcaceae bacterium]